MLHSIGRFQFSIFIVICIVQHIIVIIQVNTHADSNGIERAIDRAGIDHAILNARSLHVMYNNIVLLIDFVNGDPPHFFPSVYNMTRHTELCCQYTVRACIQGVPRLCHTEESILNIVFRKFYGNKTLHFDFKN